MGQEVANVTPKTIVSGQSVAAIVPKDLDEAYRLAKWYSAGNLTPKGIQTPEAIMSVMLMAMEVGMSPMMGLQSIAVINGRPSLWGDGLLALVMSNPLFEDIEEVVEGAGATCTIWRKGKKTPVRRTFNLEDAKLAGLLNKDGPWKTYPQRMLQMRARAWAIRDCFPDVLRGMSSAEEQQDVVMTSLEQQAPEPEPEPAPAKPSPRDVDAEASTSLPAASEEVEATLSVPDAATEADMLADLDIALGELSGIDEIQAMVETMTEGWNLSTDGERVLGDMYNRHADRIAPPPPEPEPEPSSEDPLLRDAYTAGFMAKKGASMPISWASLDDVYPAAWLQGQQDRLDGKESRYV